MNLDIISIKRKEKNIIIFFKKGGCPPQTAAIIMETIEYVEVYDLDLSDKKEIMEWIDVCTKFPNEGEYVLIFVDGYIGISRYIDGEWDTGDFRRRPMFTKSNRIMSKLEAQYWMPLPAPVTQ